MSNRVEQLKSLFVTREESLLYVKYMLFDATAGFAKLCCQNLEVTYLVFIKRVIFVS